MLYKSNIEIKALLIIFCILLTIYFSCSIVNNIKDIINFKNTFYNIYDIHDRITAIIAGIIMILVIIIIVILVILD